MKVALERTSRSGIPWTSCEPFVENKLAVLVHRVRGVTIHKIGPRRGAHLAVHCWCGNTMVGTKKFTFIAAPTDEMLVCARCDEAAIKAGRPTSEQLAGRHVHTGGVVAKRYCCENESIVAESTP